MLAMTSDATQAIEQILSEADAPDGAGIRIESAGAAQSSNGAHAEGGSLRLVLAAEPPGGDQVLEHGGARVFVEPSVSAYLEDKLLDVATDGASVSFTLAEQQEQ